MSPTEQKADARERAGKTAIQTFVATVLLAALLTAAGQLGDVDNLATVDWAKVAGAVGASAVNAAIAAAISYLQNVR